MKLALTVFTSACVFAALSSSANAKDPNLVFVGCNKNDNGCWIALARAVKENPQAEHYEVMAQEDEGREMTTSEQGIWKSFTTYTWFYNKNTKIVDYSNYHQELGVWEGEQDRKRYDQITPQLLQNFLQLKDAEKRSFDLFAGRQGSRIINNQKRVRIVMPTGVWDNNLKEKKQ